MKNKFNNLLKYIYDYSEKTQRKETVNGLFRAILEPLIANQKVKACVLLRILDNEEKTSSLKRLAFSGVQIYNYSKDLTGLGLDDNQINDIWGNTEFLIVLGGRYSAALIWDYTDSEIKNSSKVCLLYNSKIILDIAKLISENSKEDLKGLLKKYVPDRRENTLMNKSIQTIACLLNDKNEECLFSEKEKNGFEQDDDTLKTAKTVAEKAKFIAHEIKNHLSIINLYSKIANKRFENIEGQDEEISSIENALKNITKASENISYLISDLRCMSSPFKTEIRLRALVENCLDLCKERITASGAKLKEVDIKDIIISTDKVKVECAITNVIFNALDAGAKNISIETSEDSILIKNDGEEIPEIVQKKIFEEHFTTKEKGNGLGLAFCKKQLQISGGDLNLVSSNKKETIFEILL